MGYPVTHPECVPMAKEAIVEHRLMSEVFHCTPDELAEMDHQVLLLHHEILTSTSARRQKELK